MPHCSHYVVLFSVTDGLAGQWFGRSGVRLPFPICPLECLGPDIRMLQLLHFECRFLFLRLLGPSWTSNQQPTSLIHWRSRAIASQTSAQRFDACLTSRSCTSLPSLPASSPPSITTRSSTAKIAAHSCTARQYVATIISQQATAYPTNSVN